MRELKATQQWDDKFGIIDKRCGFQTEDKQCGYAMPDSMVGCTKVGDETSCVAYIPKEMKPLAKAVIDGVGADAEVVTNSRGGKQSKSPMAMHLLDPTFLKEWAGNKADELEYLSEDNYCTVDDSDKEKYNCYRAIEYIARFMENTDVDNYNNLQWALDYLCNDSIEAIISIAKVLQYGASRYKANNWRLIPQEEHINHALIHIIAHLAGDTQDEHIDHALCRLMMAYATKKSEDFDYGTFVDTNN